MFSELSCHSQVVAKVSGANSIVLSPPLNRVSRTSTLTSAVRTTTSVQEKQIFNFDYVYGDHAVNGSTSTRNTQESVFEDLGTQVIENAFAGFNTSLLAYGQTGAGSKRMTKHTHRYTPTSSSRYK